MAALLDEAKWAEWFTQKNSIHEYICGTHEGNWPWVLEKQNKTGDEAAIWEWGSDYIPLCQQPFMPK